MDLLKEVCTPESEIGKPENYRWVGSEITKHDFEHSSDTIEIKPFGDDTILKKCDELIDQLPLDYSTWMENALVAREEEDILSEFETMPPTFD